MNVGPSRKEQQRDFAHRIAYRIANKSDIPVGMMVCHTCDNPKCCNPRHLFLGTPKDNSQDMVAKGRQISGVRSKLTELDITRILGRLNNGDSPRVIAEQYSISEARVSQIKHGKYIKQLKDN